METQTPAVRSRAPEGWRLAGWALTLLGCMAAGFWLKWRLLLLPDPIGWFRASWGSMAYSDLVGIYVRDRLWTHPIPYVETRLEYPVVAGTLQYLVSWAPDVHWYFVLLSGLLVASALGILWAIAQLSPHSPLWIFAATPPLTLYGFMNWDLVGLLFLLLSLLLFDRGRHGWSALLLALGVWTKLFPVLLLPWMVAMQVRDRQWRRLLTFMALFLSVSVAVNLPFYVANPDGWLYTLRFHAGRPSDGGSVWSYLPGISVAWVDRWSLLLGAVGATWAGAMAFTSRTGMARAALVALACLFLVLKVTSPQYDLWLVPFLALASAPAALAGLFVGADLLYCWASFQALYAAWGGHGMLGEALPLVVGIANGAHQFALLAVLVWAARPKAADPDS